MSTTSSDYNLSRISAKELGENLRATIEFGGNIFVLGRRGSSKTAQAKVAIRDMNCKEIYLNASTMERTDSGGYPKLLDAKDNSFINFLLPYYYKDLIEGNTPCVALFDEIDKVDSSVLAPLLEFTQFHTINGRQLPNLKACVFTGNYAAEGGSRPTLPLLDRAEKYLIEMSHHHWLDWASKSGRIHPSITAYIADHPEDLFGDVDPGDIYADPSPRGWDNASKILSFGEEKKWNHKLLTNKVAGCVGKKVGIKYSAYFDHYQILLPIVEKIIKGENVPGFSNLEPSKQMVACMITCARLAREVDVLLEKKKKGEFPPMANTIGNFIKDVDPEMALISVRSQIGLERMVNSQLDETPVWDGILRNIVSRVNGVA
jgi:hypothetical protein